MPQKILENKNIIFFILIFYLLYLYLKPIFSIGLSGDDLYNSLIRGILLINDQSLISRIFQENLHWMQRASRFLPIMWIYNYTLFYFDPDVLVLKSFLFILIFTNLITLFYIIKYIIKNNNIALFCIAACIPFFHFKNWHDGILSMNMLMPWIFLFLNLNLLLFINVNKKPFIYKVLFVLINIISLLFYELSYIFLIFYIFLYFVLKNENSDLKIHKKLIYLSIILNFTHFFLQNFFL